MKTKNRSSQKAFFVGVLILMFILVIVIVNQILNQKNTLDSQAWAGGGSGNGIGRLVCRRKCFTKYNKGTVTNIEKCNKECDQAP